MIVDLFLLAFLMLRMEKVVGLIPFFIVFLSLIAYIFIYIKKVLGELEREERGK